MKLCHFNCRGPVFFETHCVAMIISCLSSEIFVSLIGSEHFREFHAKKLAACICESSHFYDFWTILLLPAKVEVFVLLYFFLFVRFLSTISRQRAGLFKPNFAYRRTLVPDMSSPLLGVGGPRRAEKGGNEIFVTMGIFAFWRFLSDISTTRGRIHT